jgi:hypothetical protein
MARILLLLSALAIGGIAAVIYVDAANAPPIEDNEPFADAMPGTTRTGALPVSNNADTRALTKTPAQHIKQPAATAASSPVTPSTTVSPSITAKKIARWIAQTNDEDPAVRAAAIDALGNAPKSKALPVLLQVMRSGINEDRQLALDSLYTLALQQGDEDDAIRTALRLIIYDGDEEVIISGAQIALEDIEYGLATTPCSAIKNCNTRAVR